LFVGSYIHKISKGVGETTGHAEGSLRNAVFPLPANVWGLPTAVFTQQHQRRHYFMCSPACHSLPQGNNQPYFCLLP